jgi:chemotaxis protein methyltransferase CheR
MQDQECVHFLQWVLPQLHLRWSGFRRVRKQACKRIHRRLRELGVSDFSAYRSYLIVHPEEWSVLDACCRITISRFYRDRVVFDRLRQGILPELIELARSRGDTELRCWSAGCASGEEAYTLKIIGNLCLGQQEPILPLRIIATDADSHMLERASHACYKLGNLKELPPEWLAMAFTQSDQQYGIQPTFREGIEFEQQDIRTQMPEGPFHLVLCRNLVFTYFDLTLQQAVLQRILKRLILGGVLVIGVHESLPADVSQIQFSIEGTGIYRFGNS